MEYKDTDRYKDAYVKGDILGSKARKYVGSKVKVVNQRFAVEKQFYFTLDINAFCGVIKPFQKDGKREPPLRSIRGDKIRAYADSHKFTKLTNGSSKRKIQNCRHTGHAYAYTCNLSSSYTIN